ncbi:ATP-dependent helicase/nuclease subunit A [Phycisphaerae bacterium RAS1]|nr:ATP-dependent helicase/nuclease subunit A [Phycisphaerae bacterium RAS1]
MNPRWTDAQLAAITHRGSDLLLAASAGSGKTEVLTSRYVDLLADAARPCGVTQMLVVTFTRAAAAELRVRLARLLRERAEASDTPGERRGHLRRQAALLDLAEIGTIDAWCGRLVRENFDAAGMDPAFRILDELEAEELRERELERVFEELYVESSATAEQARAWIRRHTQASDAFLRNAVRGLSRFREGLPDPDAWLRRVHEGCELSDEAMSEAARSRLAEELRCELGFQAEQVSSLASAPPALLEYARMLRGWAERLADARCLPDVLAAIENWAFPRAKRGTDSDLCDDIRKRWFEKRLQKHWERERIERFIVDAADAGRCTRTLLDIEARYQERLRVAKSAAGAYEHADVAAAALRLLGTPDSRGNFSPTPLARSLQRRYEHVLIDEFQDTSPVQVALLRLVSRDEPGRTNCFMVGDVKQSIYGFRGAEPRLFSALAADLSSQTRAGELRYLSHNFRTHDLLLEPLNALFERLFDRQFGGAAYGPEERLVAGRGELDNPSLAGEPRLSVHVLESQRRGGHDDDEMTEEDDETDLENVEREAQVAAREIHRLIHDGAMKLTRDENDAPALRPIGYEDIAILLRSAKVNAGRVAGILRDQGIPSSVCGRETILDAPEVVDVQNVLRLLVNRRQDVPLAAYLRGPLVGLSEPELLAIRGCWSGRGAFLDAVEAARRRCDDAPLRQRVTAAMDQLDAWRSVARIAALPELIRRIMSDAELPHFARGLKLGEHRVARLRAMQALAGDFSQGQRSGVAEFVAFLDRVAVSDSPPTVTVPAGRSAVPIMTIHAAKGLEYPVVFLLNSGARFNYGHRPASMTLDAKAGIGLRFADRVQRRIIRAAEHFLGDRALSQRLVEEELRLLYVAATRARERLFIIGHAAADAWQKQLDRWSQRSGPPLLVRRDAGSLLEWVLMGLAAAPSQCRSPFRVAEEAPIVRARRAPDSSPAGDAALPPAPEDAAWADQAAAELLTPRDIGWSRFPAVLSVSAVKELARRDPAADRPATLREPAAALSRPTFAGEPEDGRALGDATHRFLQLADMSRLGTPAGVAAELARLADQGRLTADAVRQIDAGDIVWLATGEVGQLLATLPLWRELPFVYAMRPSVSEPAAPGGEVSSMAHPDLPLWNVTPPPGVGGSEPLSRARSAPPSASASDEHTVVRGVIDCIAETPHGLLLVDYKTDRVRDERQLAERVAAYSMQVRLYAQAAAALLGRPVARAVLAFLRERRLVEVPLAGGAVELRRSAEGGAQPTIIDRIA